LEHACSRAGRKKLGFLIPNVHPLRREEFQMKNLISALVATMVCFLGASTVSAQEFDLECGEFAHASCVCDSGHHLTHPGQAYDANTNPCVANVAAAAPRAPREAPERGSAADRFCAFGAVRDHRGVCTCPADLGSRAHVVATYVTRAYADANADQIEAGYGESHWSGPNVYLQVCADPLAREGEPGSVSRIEFDALDHRLDIVCAGSTDDNCTATRAIIDSVGPRTTIHYGDRDYTLNEFSNSVIIPRIINIEEQIAALRAQVGEDDGRGPLTPRVAALEDAAHTAATSDGPNSFAVTLGAMAELGFATYGPMTLSGDAMATLLFRPGTSRFDWYLRARGGAALTGWSTGSAHIAASTGLSFYLDDHLRRGLTLAVGAWAEDLLDLGPDGPGQVRGDTLGFAAGGEVNLGIPVGDGIHIELGAAVGYSERYGVASNGMDLAVFPALYVAPHVGLTFQL
jgi:hypothetical protein